MAETVAGGQVKRYVIGYNLNGSASNGEDVIVRLNANSDVSATGATTSNVITPVGSAPYTGGTKTMSSTGTLDIVAGTNNSGNKNEANSASNIGHK